MIGRLLLTAGAGLLLSGCGTLTTIFGSDDADVTSSGSAYLGAGYQADDETGSIASDVTSDVADARAERRETETAESSLSTSAPSPSPGTGVTLRAR